MFLRREHEENGYKMSIASVSESNTIDTSQMLDYS